MLFEDLNKVVQISFRTYQTPEEVKASFDNLIPMQQKLFQAILKAYVEEVRSLLPILDINAQDHKTQNAAIHFATICLRKNITLKMLQKIL